MKKIKYLVFSLIILFGFGMGVLGLDCNYSDGKLFASFRIEENSNSPKVGRVSLRGQIETSDRSHKKKGISEEESVKNWKDEFKKIDFTGLDYYNEKETCAPYGITIDAGRGLMFFVSDEANKSKFEQYGKKKQGYAIMNLVEVKGDSEDENQYYGNSCGDYKDDSSCEDNPYYSCLWVDNEKYSFLKEKDFYCNTDNLLYVACGDAYDIPYQVPQLISFLVNLLKIATPIILIFISVITLVKALAASKEDEIKKAQSSLIKKIIAAVMVFFVISIVQFVIMKVADNTEESLINGETEITNMSSCLTCFLNNDCDQAAYYKTNEQGEYKCISVKTKEELDFCLGNK